MNVDHIGYAVKNIDASRQAFEELGYVFDPVVNDTDRNIFISFGRLGDYRIELVSPLDPALPSPVDGTLKKSGNTPYHICYTSSRFEDDIKELQQKAFSSHNPARSRMCFRRQGALLSCIISKSDYWNWWKPSRLPVPIYPVPASSGFAP